MIRKTKIIATIGPSTSSKEMLSRIIQRGVNVCRLNFSHLSYKKAKEIIKEKEQVIASQKMEIAKLKESINNKDQQIKFGI